MSATRRSGHAVLLAVLRDRARLKRFTDAEWSAFLTAAERARLLPRLALEVEQLGLSFEAPWWALDRLAAARVKGRQYEREIRWEIGCVRRALSSAGVDPVFLKGAAYVAAGLACGVGRVVADLDILVDEVDIPVVEKALHGHGWEFEPLEKYDERYYREWMHELPPMRHRERGTMLDVHHRILPRTGRIHPPTRRLLEKSTSIGGVRVLSPSHRLLHACAHLFQDGEVAGSLRDLVDIATLGEGDAMFWRDVASEAESLQLGRSLYYATRYVRRLGLGALPSAAGECAACWAPAAPVGGLMDALVGASLRPETAMSRPASQLLVARAHWLKMPVSLLIPHLWSKVSRRASGAP